jgi:predicted Zn-dependent peptidase
MGECMERRKPKSMYRKATTENGLRILTWPMKDTKTASVLVFVGLGSRYETKDLVGIAHFLEHMLGKGTKKRPDPLSIASEIDGVGGEFNGFTGTEYTLFYVKLPAEHVFLAVDVLSDIICNSRLDEEHIELEKGVILQEINHLLDTPSQYVLELYHSLLYGDHPLGWDITTSREVVPRLDREKLTNLWQNCYTPDNMVVAVAGKIDPGKVISWVRSHFGSSTGKKSITWVPAKEDQAKPAFRALPRKTDQTHICLGMRTFISVLHPDRYILEVLNTILGGCMSSRLFIKIREEMGLVYSIGSGIQALLDTGSLSVEAGTDGRKVGEVVGAILGEFYRLRESLLKPDELQRAKNYVKGKIIMGLENSEGLAYFLGKQELLQGRIRTVEEIMEEVEKVSREDIRRVSENIFQEKNLNLALLGSFDEKLSFERLLKI